MKKVLRRIMMIFLPVMFVIGLIPFAGINASAVNVGTEDALAKNAEAGGAIKLTKDIALTKALIIPEGVTVTLDLNGKKLDRGLTDAAENGSVIIVKEGASLTVSDSSGNNAGLITGGASQNGGGILNSGELSFEGGTISGNKASGKEQGSGGGIYNEGSLTLCGGVIQNNSAQNGGAVYNNNGSVVIEQKKVTKKVGIDSKTYLYDVTITGNKAENRAGGIYNSSLLKISGDFKIYDNSDCDIFLSDGKTITIAGELKNTDKIVVGAESSNAVITSGYSEYNTKKPSEFFASRDTGAVLMFSSAENGEVMLKTGGDTVIQVFENGKIVKRESADSSNFVGIWNKAMGYSKDNKSVWGSTTDDSVVEITLGADFTYDAALDVTPRRNIVIDLNGHCLKRSEKKQKNGYLIKVGERAKLTVKDSNPNSNGYKNHKGGVLADGSGDDCGGGIVVEKYGSFYMLGGTIYNCVTNYHGGAVYAGGDSADVIMQDCTIDACQTKNSGDDCHGGGIYSKNSSNVVLKNVTIKNCKSEDKGGALYLREKPGNVNLQNVVFENNFANDGGGAIFIDDLKSSSEFTFEAVNCTFSKNSAKADGGAVYVYDDDESEYRNPTIFRNCTFTENESAKYGGAMEVNDNGVVLSGGTFTNNKAGGKGGAIYVEGEYDISVAGLLVIKDNDGKDNYDNLCLEENSDHKAYVYDAGLYDGSDVYLSTSNNKTGITAVKNVSEYQAKFFHADKGSLSFKKTGTAEAVMVTASLFGNGSVKIIIICAAAAILFTAGITVFVIKKKKRSDKDGTGSEEE